jgi:dihydroorotate dehydrogenase (fumarate)
MGLKLKNPIVHSSSPLSNELDKIKILEGHGASAIVMESLFEEQIIHEQESLDHFLTQGTESFAEALSYFPEVGDYRIGPEEYLEHLRKAKEAVDIPIIASLNGVSKGGWMDYARKIQETGVDGLELNVYYIPTDPEMPGSAVEEMYIESVKAVKEQVTIPVAVKVGPHFSNTANMAKRLDEAGADALVLFNRFYQPDIDLDNLTVEPNLVLSTSAANRLSLRWIAILYGRFNASLAATNGVHTQEDVVKLLMAGADVTMMCAALLKNGIPYLEGVLKGLQRWMEEHEYESVDQLKGSLSQKSCPEPAAFERANYMKALTSYT